MFPVDLRWLSPRWSSRHKVSVRHSLPNRIRCLMEDDPLGRQRDRRVEIVLALA